MPRNLGTWDRAARTCVAVILLALGLWRGAWTLDFLILSLVAAAILLTAALGFDPLYRIYGITTLSGLRRLPCEEHGDTCRPDFHRR